MTIKEETAQTEDKDVTLSRNVPKKKQKKVSFGRYFEIHFDQPIDFLSTPTKWFYVATNIINQDQDYMAVVSNSFLPPRKRSMRSYESMSYPSKPELLDHGVLKTGDDDIERYVLIYSNIFKSALPVKAGNRYPILKEPDLVSKIIKPMNNVFMAMQNSGFVHGAIRVENLYQVSVDGRQEIAFGECLACSAGYEQPTVYETIERGTAMPSGRGMGSLSTDLYSFGVTLAFLILGDNFMAGMSDGEIITQKLLKGSFSAIVGANRIPPSLSEVLRGLLADNHRLRWTVDDLNKWCEGQRLSPKQSIGDFKASRFFEFAGQKISSPRLLARELFNNKTLALSVIEDGSLRRWVERSLEGRISLERYENAVQGLIMDKKNPALSELLVSRVVIALDPKGPIRYKNISVLPSAYGNVMAELFATKQDISPMQVIIEKQLISLWASCQHESTEYDLVQLISSYDACRGFFLKKVIGNGPERVLYYINKEARCLSPLFDAYYVDNPTSLLFTLEKVASYKERPSDIFDSHTAAFLAVHYSASKEGDIYLLGAYDLTARYTATLILLASLQNYAEISKLPSISNWVFSMIESIVSNFYNDQLKKKVTRKLEEAAKNGNLIEMKRIIQDTSLIREDLRSFEEAKMEYYKASLEQQKLERDLSKATIGFDTGREIAAILSAVLSVLGLILFILMHYGGL